MGIRTFVLLVFMSMSISVTSLMPSPVKAVQRTTQNSTQNATQNASEERVSVPYCYPHFHSLKDSMTVYKYETLSFEKNLWSEDLMENAYETPVLLYGEVAGDQGLMKLLIQFDSNFDGVSLPYTLYGVKVFLMSENEEDAEKLSEEKLLVSYDFTNACNAPGVSIFSHQKIILPDIPLEFYNKHSLLNASNRMVNKKLKLLIAIWGR